MKLFFFNDFDWKGMEVKWVIMVSENVILYTVLCNVNPLREENIYKQRVLKHLTLKPLGSMCRLWKESENINGQQFHKMNNNLLSQTIGHKNRPRKIAFEI